MEVTVYKMKLSQAQVQDQQKKSQIRTVKLPRKNCYYYSKLNLLTQFDYRWFDIYFINETKVVWDKALTENMSQKFPNSQKIFFLEKFIIIYKQNQFIKFNVENFEECQISKGFLESAIDILNYWQINKKSFMTTTCVDNKLRIYSLRNFKKSHTTLNKFTITSTYYYSYIVQGYSDIHLYCYITRMSKQIRKYYRNKQDKQTFDSNYLFVSKFDKEKLISLIIYDIQSMRRKGVLVVKTYRTQLQYDSCIFIKDFNVIGILYKTQLDLYDFNTLNFIDCQKLNNQLRDLNMTYDEYNGLTIFIQ